MERLLAAGVLDREEPPEEEDGPAPDCDDERAEVPRTQAEESDSSTGVRGGRLRRSWRKVWRKIRGNISQERRQSKKTFDRVFDTINN